MTTARVVRLGEKVAAFIDDAVKAAVSAHKTPIDPPPPPAVTVRAPEPDVVTLLGAVTRDHLDERKLRAEREYDVLIAVVIRREADRAEVGIRLVARNHRTRLKSFAFVDEDALHATTRSSGAREMDRFASLWFGQVDAAWKCLVDQLERQRVVSIQEVLV